MAVAWASVNSNREISSAFASSTLAECLMMRMISSMTSIAFSEAFQNVRPLLGLLQFELGPADDDIVAELDEVGDHFLKRQRPRAALDKGDIVEREAGLKLGVLEQGVEHDVGVAALLDPYDDADTLAEVSSLM